MNSDEMKKTQTGDSEGKDSSVIMQSRLDRGFERYQKEYESAALKVLRSGWYVLGNEVSSFEKEFASYIGTRYCVGLASGLDALWLAFRVLGIGKGDEVIVQGNAYIASVMGITINDATPVFVEPDSCYEIDVDRIEEKITDRTKAVLVVHLYGQPARMDKVQELCRKYHLRLVEDCAQSHGASFHGQMTGSFGDVGCFSFYPSKNLGAFGDGGAVTVNDPELDHLFRVYRNYGSEKRYYNEVVGANSRLDEIQAALLRVKLTHLDEINRERTDLAAYYSAHIDNPLIRKPQTEPDTTPVWHQYVIRMEKGRDALQAYLMDHNIKTLIHYPIPPHLSKAYQYLQMPEGSLPVTEQYAKEVLSLPMYTGMTRKEQDRVISCLNRWTGEQ